MIMNLMKNQLMYIMKREIMKRKIMKRKIMKRKIMKRKIMEKNLLINYKKNQMIKKIIIKN